MQKINTILIDDEDLSVISLKSIIKNYCPEINIIGQAQSAIEGVECINRLKPNLVFLDIAMPGGDGFEVLKNVSFTDFEVIFITAYNDYALKAFEFSALSYLLKPVIPKELQNAVSRFSKYTNNKHFDEKLSVMNDSLNDNNSKIILPTQEELIITDLDDILYLESSKNYSIFYLKDNKDVLVSRSINHFEKIFSDTSFFRIHNQHLVNLKYIKRYVKGKGGYIVLTNDVNLDVSERKKKEFMAKLKEIANSV